MATSQASDFESVGGIAAGLPGLQGRQKEVVLGTNRDNYLNTHGEKQEDIYFPLCMFFVSLWIAGKAQTEAGKRTKGNLR